MSIKLDVVKSLFVDKFIRAKVVALEEKEINFENPLAVGGFGSFHAGGIGVFVMADGSVNAMPVSIDPAIFRLMGHRADGELIKNYY